MVLGGLRGIPGGFKGYQEMGSQKRFKENQRAFDGDSREFHRGSRAFLGVTARCRGGYRGIALCEYL